MIEWPGAHGVRQLPFRRLFRPIQRPIWPDAGIVTAYTDGQVTLRSNRSKIGYHEAADLSSYQGVRVGDFVVHGLDIMRGSVGVSDSDGAISSVCTVCVAAPEINPYFAAYAIRAEAAANFPKALARGVREGGADFRRWDTLAELPVPVPPLTQQRQIVEHLDRETGMIDALIAKQEQLVSTLTDRRQAVITNMVTYGSPRSSAEGEMPAGWAVMRLGSIADRIVDCLHTTAESDPDGDYVVVRTSSVRDGKFFPEHGYFTDRRTYVERIAKGKPTSGDVFLTREAPAGEACLVPADIATCLGQRMVLITPRREAIDPQLLVWNIYMPLVRQYLDVETSGSTVQNLTMPRIQRLPIVVPERTKQAKLVEDIKGEIAVGDQLIQKAALAASGLLERRQALISAAVTGKIDVRGL